MFFMREHVATASEGIYVSYLESMDTNEKSSRTP